MLYLTEHYVAIGWIFHIFSKSTGFLEGFNCKNINVTMTGKPEKYIRAITEHRA